MRNATCAAACWWSARFPSDWRTGRRRASSANCSSCSAAICPPPAGLRSPALWGTEERLRELFGHRLDSITIERRDFVFRYRSAAHWLEVFRTFYGPMVKAFGALDSAKQESLAADLIALAERFNRANDGSLVAPSQYAEVVIKRR